MDTDSQIDLVGYRVFVVRALGSQLLLISNGPRFALPEIQIPAFARAAQSVATTMRRLWALELVCLYPTETYGGDLHRYYLVEALKTQHTIPHAVWVGVSSLTKDFFLDRNDYETLLACLARCCRSLNPNSAPFETIGWFATVCRWVDDVIKPSGLYLTGEFQQINASPAFSLIRFQTNRSAVWFKAVGKPNVREVRISQYLAKAAPAFTSEILGTHTKWNAWLMPEVEGIHPDAQSDVAVWITVARTLARLQVASVGHTLHLISAGCRDMRVGTLLDGFDDFVEAIACWMSHQTKEVTLSRDELHGLGAQLKSLLIEFQTFDIPSSLGHLDFNPCNIVVSADRCVFLDWAEGYVGHPFFTFEYLRQHIRRLQTNVSWEATVTHTYAHEWLALADATSIRRALTLSPLIAKVVYAFSADCWHHPKTETAPEVADYLHSLILRIHRETRRLLSNRNLNGGHLSTLAEEIRSC